MQPAPTTGPLTPSPQSLAPTPCAEAFGPGPEGWRCGSCANLQAVHVEGATVYYCCLDGAPTASGRPAERDGARQVTSAACSRFEEAPLILEMPCTSP